MPRIPQTLAAVIHLPWPILIYSAMGILTFALYAVDKSRSKQNQRRIPESTLHICELLGGIIGAFAAQRLLRHKNRKTRFQLIFWIIVVLHLMFWLWRWGWVHFGRS